MSEPEKVDAKVIESDLSPLAASELWLAGARERVAELAAQYRVPDEITTDREYKDAKQSRASVRKDAAAIDVERKATTRAMDDALRKFRDGVKDVLLPLTELDVAYKAALDAYDERWGQERRQALQETYDEYAPDLVPLVPLDRLIAKYGSDRGKGWLTRSVNVEAAKAGLRGSVDSIAAGERTVEGAVAPEDAEGAKADYFSTLDVGQAIQAAQARAEQRERVRRLEEERRAREEEQRRIEAEAAERRRQQELERQRREEEYQRMRADAERIERERAEAQTRAKQEDEPEDQPLATGAVMSPEEAAQAWQATTPNVPTPRPLVEHIAASMGQPEPGSVPPYLMCCYGTRADADAFKLLCEQRGMKPTIRPTGGSIFRIVRK